MNNEPPSHQAPVGTKGRLVVITGRDLTLEDIAVVAAGTAEVVIAPAAMSAVREAVALRDRLLGSGMAIYGVTTGFGDSVIRQVSPEKSAELQKNLIRYHLNGTGPDTENDVVRAMLLIRANCLAAGRSGVSVAVVERLAEQLNRDILPRVPQRGSVGASGDLVPLCYLAAAVIGEGQVSYRGQHRPAAEVLAETGLAPLSLAPKDGLALINGTTFSAAYAARATLAASRLARIAELCTAMASEALLGNRSHFDAFIHQAKPHKGQVRSAAAIASLLSSSGLSMEHDQVVALAGGLDGAHFSELDRPIQDRYSIRCAPHVIGVLHDTVEWVRHWLEIEINSSNDNPLFDVPAQKVHSGGNFYGGHVGQAMDSLKVAVANVADLLDRQMELVVDEKFNNGLTANLIPRFSSSEWRAGLHHGFKGMQIACSAITAEALKQSNPATLFSRSTEAHNQDKVSMSAIAARDAGTVVALTEEVAAIHLLALCQALELRGPEHCAPGIRHVHEAVRARIHALHDDRAMDQDISLMLDLMRSDTLTDPVGTPG